MTIMVIEIEMELSRRKLRFFGRFISSVEREFLPTFEPIQPDST